MTEHVYMLSLLGILNALLLWCASTLLRDALRCMSILIDQLDGEDDPDPPEELEEDKTTVIDLKSRRAA